MINRRMPANKIDSSNHVAGQTRLPIWRTLIPVGLGTGLSLIGDAGLYTILPTHTQEAGVTLASVGILLSANRFVRLVSNGSVGWITDRVPRRPVFVTALLLGAISTAVYSFTSGFWPLLVGRLLWGIAWSGIWVAGNAIVLDIAGSRNRGRLIGLYHISFFTGSASGSLLGGILTDVLGYRRAMAIAAGLTLSGMLIALLFLPRGSSRSNTIHQEAAVTVPSSTDGKGRKVLGEMASAAALLGVNRVVIAGILASTFGVFLSERLGDHITFGRQTIGVATLTGLGLGVSTLLSMLFTPLVGTLSDRTGDRWRVAGYGLTAGAAGFSLLGWGVPWAIPIALPMIFFASSSNQGLSTALIGDLSVGLDRGRILGMLFTVGDLGSAIGPPLAYLLLPFWGTQGVYWLNVVLFTSVLFMSVRWSRSLQHRMLTTVTPGDGGSGEP